MIPNGIIIAQNLSDPEWMIYLLWEVEKAGVIVSQPIDRFRNASRLADEW